MAYEVKIICDSVAPNGVRLTSFQATFPRIILAEVNTHRMLSRNSASSRAIPVAKQIERVLADPFVPDKFPKNQKGMQTDEYWESDTAEYEERKQLWLFARDAAVKSAEILSSKDVAKGITNRLLEPFMWHTAILSATDWANLFFQRCHRAAQHEFQILSNMLRQEYNQHTPALVDKGEWHLPYIQPCDANIDNLGVDTVSGLEIQPHELWGRNLAGLFTKVSAARCARVSYLTQEGKRDIAEDLKLFDRLVSRGNSDDPGHWSPLEHVAIALDVSRGNQYYGNFRGWKQLRKMYNNENKFG